jgi:hypothetical protein
VYDSEDPSPTPSPSGSSRLPSHYRAQLLSGAEPTADGLAYRRGEESELLAWSRVRRAFAAEVGEPEGIRTVVFDLVIGIEGTECVAFRFDAEPGDDARSVARAIDRGVGPERCDASLHSVAEEGFASCTHPDLEPFDDACLASVRRRPFGLRATPAADGPTQAKREVT